MRFLLLIIPLFYSGAFAAEQGGYLQPTYAQYKMHRALQAGRAEPLDHWINGYLAAILEQQVLNKLDGLPVEFCPPRGEAVRSEIFQIIDGYAAYYSKIVATLSPEMPLSVVVRLSLKRAYPCPSSQPRP